MRDPALNRACRLLWRPTRRVGGSAAVARSHFLLSDLVPWTTFRPNLLDLAREAVVRTLWHVFISCEFLMSHGWIARKAFPQAPSPHTASFKSQPREI